MYQYQNYITQAIHKNKIFYEKAFLASCFFNNYIEDVFFTSKDKTREVKVYRTPKNTELYIFEMILKNNADESSFQIFVKTIEDFEKEESTMSLMKYPLFSLQKDEPIHESCIILFSPKLKTTSSLLTLRNYIQLLEDNNYLDIHFDNDFYKTLTEPLNQEIENKLDTIVSDIEHLYNVSKAEGFDVKKAFEFNDLDNHVYLKDSKMMVTDQNCIFCIDMSDNKNLTVYLLPQYFDNIQDELQKIDHDVENGTVDEISNVILQVKNGKVTFVDNLLYEIFEMDVDFSLKALKEQGYSERVFPVDIYSYEYQKNYYYTKYNLSEIEFLAQAFLTLGGGFDYDKEKGILVDDNVKYLKKIKKEKLSDKKVTHLFYCYPKKISHLNKEWTEGLKTLVETLKRDIPKLVAFDGNDSLDAVQKAIKYYEIKLSKLEKMEKLNIQENITILTDSTKRNKANNF